jgi:hypothetical protein
VHDRKALLTGLRRAAQRIAPHEVDVIRDEHEGAAREGTAYAAGGVGDDENLDAQVAEDARRQARGGG